MTEIPDGEPCDQCGKQGRMYKDENAGRFMAGLRHVNVKVAPGLQPSLEHLAAQANRRIERVAKMYDAAEGTDIDELLDDIDSLLVSVWHLYDWIRNDPNLDPRICGQVDQFVSASDALKVCRAYVNTYKHRVRNGSWPAYARVLDYQRAASSRPYVRIVSWRGRVPPEEFTDSVEALDLARQGMDEWARFAEVYGNPDGVPGSRTPN